MADQPHLEFGTRLRVARLAAGKSQERIAAEVGTSRRQWLRWEGGYHLPSQEYLDRIGAAVGQANLFAADGDGTPEDDDEEAASMRLLELLYSQLGTALGKAPA
jgi:transcriptional regulator with XRE-family HTH domain